MWQEICSGKDSQGQVEFIVEKRSDDDRVYRCCFTRLREENTDLDAAFFDPLSGELEAIEELTAGVRLRVDELSEQLAAFLAALYALKDRKGTHGGRRKSRR